MNTDLKGFTIIAKIEINLEGLPPEKTEELKNSGLIPEIARELKEELKDDLNVPPDLSERVKISVEVFEWSLDEADVEDFEKTYQEFWKPIVENAEGHILFEQIKKELHDFRTLMCNTSLVYEHITGGLISKPFTDPEVVKTMADDYSRQCCDEEIAEMQGLANP